MKQRITLETKRNEHGDTWCTVSADVLDDLWALIPITNDQRRICAYSLTHRPSGFSFGYAPNKRAARSCIELFNIQLDGIEVAGVTIGRELALHVSFDDIARKTPFAEALKQKLLSACGLLQLQNLWYATLNGVPTKETCHEEIHAP